MNYLNQISSANAVEFLVAKLSLQLPLAEYLYLQLLFVVVVRPSRIVTSPLISLKSKNFKKQSAFIFEFWFRVALDTQ